MPSEEPAAQGSTRTCSALGALVGATSTAGLVCAWPVQQGVIWTAAEQGMLFALGAGTGGLLGGLLGWGSHRAGPSGACVAGMLPSAILLAVPWIPVAGRTVLRADPATLGLLAGAALVYWGVVRSLRHPVLHALLATIPVGLLALAWPTEATQHRTAPSAPGPDVLLITVDTTRADLIPGFHGDRSAADMPGVAAWSKGARRFDRAYAPTALTGPSHTSILSGRHVMEHGIVANGRDVPLLLPMVAMRFQHHGWHTQAWVSAAVLEARLGFDRGFNDYDSRFTDRLQYGHPLFALWPRRRTGGTGFVREDSDTVDRVLARGLSDPEGHRRTFTWVHLYGPHWPYEPDPDHAAALGVAPTLDGSPHIPIPLNLRSDLDPAVKAHAVALYRAELRTLDDQLTRLLDAAGPNAHIVLVADHGESLDEHGLLFNHGRLSTTPTARVPLWIRGPSYAPGLDERTVSIHQVAATLLALGGLPTDAMGTPIHETADDAVAVTLSANSVFEADADATAPDLGDLASLGVRQGRWSRSASLWHQAQWFDLSTDPSEQQTIPADAVPDHARSAITTMWERVVARRLDAPDDIDADTEAALRALGYIEPSANTD